MGNYHGKPGFDTFSHLKSVFHQSKLNGAFLLERTLTGFKAMVADLLQKII